MESIYMMGRALAIICVLVIVGYGLFIRPKEEDAPKRMSTFRWIMKKRREKQAAEQEKVRDMKDFSNIPRGDMPGDKIVIEEKHLAKAEVIYPALREKMQEFLAAQPGRRLVVGVCGGSGVGKSETASLLAWMLHEDGIEAYILSGDNYPHRIPAENDAERRRVFREKGAAGLEEYLGSNQEVDFDRVGEICREFKVGVHTLRLKRMGRTREDIWEEDVDVSDKEVLIIEWTHAGSSQFDGVDIIILLNSTPEETLAHRRKRARDGEVDSPFTKQVLEIEQAHLNRDAHRASIILTKDGRLIDYDRFCQLMGLPEPEGDSL